MCLIITYTVKGPSDAETRGRLLGGKWSELVTPNVAKLLAANEAYGMLLSRGCDCDTPLGSRARVGEPIHDDDAREVDALRRKGWGATKIERWRENHARAKAKDERALESRLALDESTTREWVKLLSSALSSEECEGLGLLLHQYRSDVATTWLEEPRTVTLSLDELTEDTLLDLREDVLYRFVP